MSFTIYTGATCSSKQQKVITCAHELASHDHRACVFLFPQVAIAKDFSHTFVDDLTFNDASYSLDRWIEKLWEQLGTTDAVISREKREALISESAIAVAKSKNLGVGEVRFIQLPGVQSIINQVIARAGRSALQGKVHDFLGGTLGEGALQVVGHYFDLLVKHHFIEKVDAIHELARKQLDINQVIVVDGFNDFTPEQIELIGELSKNNDVILMMNYSEKSTFCQPLNSIISDIQSKYHASTTDLSSEDGACNDALSEWRLHLESNDLQVHQSALESGSLAISLATSPMSEIVCIGEAIKEALSSFRPQDITVACPRAADIHERLSRYLALDGIELIYDMVLPLKASVFGGAVLDFLASHQRLSGLIDPAIVYDYQPVSKASSALFSPIGDLSQEDFFALDEKVRSTASEFAYARKRTYELNSEADSSKKTLFTLLDGALRSKNQKAFKELFDAMLAHFLAKDCLTSSERSEAALAHHEIIRLLTVTATDADAKNETGTVDVQLFIGKMLGASLKFSQSQHTQAVLLSDMARVRGRRVPCLIVAGLENENFIDSQTLSIDQEIEAWALLHDKSTAAKPPLTSSEESGLLIHEVISAAQQKLVLIGQRASSKGEVKDLVPFFEKIINLFDRRSADREVGDAYLELREQLSLLQNRGITVYDSLDEKVRAVELSLGGKMAELSEATDMGIKVPLRGEHAQPLYPPELMFEAHEFSPSSLEAFAACPYRWYLNSYLASNTIDRQFGPPERGTLIHDTLESFYKAWKETYGSKRIAPANIDDARALFEKASDAYLEEKLSYLKHAKNPEHQEFLSRAVEKAWSRVVADMEILGSEHGDVCFYPDEFELRMGKGRVGDEPTDENLQAWVGDVKITGSIDRVDRDVAGNRFVIDYKGNLSDYKNGSKWLQNGKIQTLLYWLALENATNENVVGAAYSSYEKGNDLAYFVDEDIIPQKLLRENGKAIEMNIEKTLGEIRRIATDGAHLMHEGNVPIAKKESLNGYKLDENKKGCKYCLYQLDCPVLLGSEGGNN